MDKLEISLKKVSIVFLWVAILITLIVSHPSIADGDFIWLLLITFVATLLVSDLMSRKYIFLEDGMKVKWYFHTFFYPWSSFVNIAVEPASHNLEDLIICFDRGISRISIEVDPTVHPFKFFVVEVSDCFSHKAFAGVGLPAVSKEDFLQFLDGKNINVANVDLLIMLNSK